MPEILARDTERGFLLLGDLGDRPWHKALDEHNADAMFADAIGALVTMQENADCRELPEFDAALLLRELSLFPDWFLARHWAVEPTDPELDDWEMVCMTLIRWALDQPQVFVHRDFMPRNLMVSDPNPGILDFQDAVVGPISYDPVCLFRDAFLSWPAERVDGWLENYRQRALAKGLPVADDARLWQRTCDLIGVQRHLKVLGIFARIRYRDGKKRYLEDAPRFFAYLKAAIDRNPELGPLDRCSAPGEAGPSPTTEFESRCTVAASSGAVSGAADSGSESSSDPPSSSSPSRSASASTLFSAVFHKFLQAVPEFRGLPGLDQQQ